MVPRLSKAGARSGTRWSTAGAVTLLWGTLIGGLAARWLPMAVALRCGTRSCGTGVLEALYTDGLKAT
jgi:hypothetical protein